jgi:hypothetical protein
VPKGNNPSKWLIADYTHLSDESAKTYTYFGYKVAFINLALSIYYALM